MSAAPAAKGYTVEARDAGTGSVLRRHVTAASYDDAGRQAYTFWRSWGYMPGRITVRHGVLQQGWTP